MATASVPVAASTLGGAHTKSIGIKSSAAPRALVVGAVRVRHAMPPYKLFDPLVRWCFKHECEDSDTTTIDNQNLKLPQQKL